jgi:LDH2 family malate/lactate/ureidoglycolate dehydrogenase
MTTETRAIETIAETEEAEWAGAVRVTAGELTAFVAALFGSFGLAEAAAGKAAETLVLADLRGVDSHGVARMPFYADRIKRGKINLGARLRTLREGAATLALDADNGLGLLLATEAMERCVAKAEASGLCLATVRQSNHFGIAGAYALLAARRGLGGLAMTNSGPLVVPLHGARAMLGTNPIAVAVPTGPGDEPPLVLDMATSAVAWGKIENARRAKRAVPMGWALDEAGQPTTDPWAAHWLTPLGGDREQGGHKGYGLAVVVDVLCGPLAGAAWSAEIASFRNLNRPANLGHVFMAWRIDAFREPADFYADVRAMLADLRATPPAVGHEAGGVLVPGDPEIAAEAANRAAGIPVKPAVANELRALAAELGQGAGGAGGSGGDGGWKGLRRLRADGVEVWAVLSVHLRVRRRLGGLDDVWLRRAVRGATGGRWSRHVDRAVLGGGAVGVRDLRRRHQDGLLRRLLPQPAGADDGDGDAAAVPGVRSGDVADPHQEGDSVHAGLRRAGLAEGDGRFPALGADDLGDAGRDGAADGARQRSCRGGDRLQR